MKSRLLSIGAFAIAMASAEVSQTFLGPTKAGLNAGFSTPIDKKLDPVWEAALFDKGTMPLRSPLT